MRARDRFVRRDTSPKFFSRLSNEVCVLAASFFTRA
ncbi:hypothetical protein CSUI_009472 [Cystoisospora suis]|uniref:Uncharacterized protein n=1 Tax=Cystoisospora suis TaxID=483139 RepID=A0A2C6JH75_9APIC|nr:hypothetical protein CSUI_009472 [Cystoisospora suis]